jgi:hypothetical protein
MHQKSTGGLRVIEQAYGLRVREITVLSIRDVQLCLSVCWEEEEMRGL